MNKNATPKQPPTFASEQEEREYWESHEAADIVDWEKARSVVFPDLRPSAAATSRPKSRTPRS